MFDGILQHGAGSLVAYAVFVGILQHGAGSLVACMAYLFCLI